MQLINLMRLVVTSELLQKTRSHTQCLPDFLLMVIQFMRKFLYKTMLWSQISKNGFVKLSTMFKE